MKKILLSTALLSCFVFAKDVNVGVVLPLTGPVAAYGQDVLAGVELANKIMPKAKNGDTINLVVLDSKGDKVETSTAALRLVSKDKVVTIIGEATTPNTMQVISVAEDKKVPMIAPVASGDKLLDNKKYSSRVCFMDSFQGQKFADYAIDTLKYKACRSTRTAVSQRRQKSFIWHSRL